MISVEQHSWQAQRVVRNCLLMWSVHSSQKVILESERLSDQPFLIFSRWLHVVASVLEWQVIRCGGDAVWLLLVFMLTLNFQIIHSMQVVPLDWWPLTRDCLAYGFTVAVLICIIHDERVEWYEALILVLLYAVYIAVMYFDKTIQKWARGIAFLFSFFAQAWFLLFIFLFFSFFFLGFLPFLPSLTTVFLPTPHHGVACMSLVCRVFTNLCEITFRWSQTCSGTSAQIATRKCCIQG